MPIETLSSKFELLDTISSSDDSDVSVIRRRENGELFLLKHLKDGTGPGNDAGRKLHFKREMDFVSSLDHPNIAKPVFPLGGKGIDAIAYPYRKGQTLSSLLEVISNFSPLEALHITRQLLDALEYLHGRGIIHCNINPNNLYIDDEKGLQLLDFGMAITDDEASLMPEGKTIGTMPWLSPEQTGFTGFRIDPRSDLYDAGIILYRLLSGRMPFELKNTSGVEELLNLAIHTEVQPLHGVPLSVNAVLLKALKPTPAERYQTAAGFKHDVAETVEHVKKETHGHFIAGKQDAIIAVNRSRLFIGRERELEALKEGLGALLHGGGSASFCIHGKSGTGKTEIVREFRRSIAEDRSFFLSVKCNVFTARQPYSIFRHLVLDFIAKINSRGREQADAFSAAAEGLLRDYAGVICKITPEMRPFFKEVRPIDVVEPEKEADRTAHALFTLLSTLCTFKPLVIFIDDLQWIDRVSFEIVRYLLCSGRAPARMVIAALRTDVIEGDLRVQGFDLRKAGFQRFLSVAPFSRAEVNDLVSSRFGRVADKERLIGLLAEKTDCAPFALAETFRFLVNRAVLTTDGKKWSLSEKDLSALPDKLDPLSLILRKIDDCAPDEQQWLETASLAEGRFRSGLIETAGGFPLGRSAQIIERLDNDGFICPQLGGGYRFIHDQIQESVRDRIPAERKLLLYEKFGAAYETMTETDKRFLFHAAESYLKSENLSKAISLSYQAARYAADTAALDIAARYFTRTHLLTTQSVKSGMVPPIDTVRMQIEFGDVLMLTGRNEQALNMFKMLLEGNQMTDRLTRLDIQYKIGTIHHNTGNFDASTEYFFDALRELGVKFHDNIFLIIATLLIEILKQIVLSLGIKSLLRKKSNSERLLSVRILNKLAYSLFFKSILLEQYAHFRALNIADRLVDCAEKMEAYSSHTVASLMLFMKKRSLSYFRQAIEMAGRINRKDTLAFAQSMGGVACYFNGQWKTAEKYLNESSATYKSIGDRWGQIVPFETNILLDFQKGDFQQSKPLIEKLIILDEDCNDSRGLANAHMFSAYVKFLEGKSEDLDWNTLIEERDTAISNVPLNKTLCNTFITKRLLLNNQLKDAYSLSISILDDIKRNNLIQEYVAGAFSDRCEILIKEYHNRHFAQKSQRQIDLSDRALLRELRRFIVLALVRGVMYPAHRGA